MGAKYAFGIFLLVLVSVIWVAASHLIKGIYDDFEKPAFLTYFNTAGFSMWLSVGYCSGEWRRDLPCGKRGDSRGGLNGWREYCKEAVVFAPVWFLANFAFNLSLTGASVASNSILSNTSSLWTMVLSSFVLGEQIGVLKIVAVLLTLTGVSLVAFTDTSQPHDASSDTEDTFSGDALALFSACCSAVYTVLLRYRLPDTVHMPIFFGYVGAVTLVLGMPFLVLFDLTGFELFALPNKSTLTLLVANAIVGTNISDVLWAKAVILTSPVIATVALSLTIPFGMLSDALLTSKQFTLPYTAGAIFVLAGFILINAGEWIADQALRGVNSLLGVRTRTHTHIPDDASEEELQSLTDSNT